MKHLFVPYEIAKQLKEKGFNEPCLAYYQHIRESDNNISFLIIPRDEYSNAVEKQGDVIFVLAPFFKIVFISVFGIKIN